MLLLLAACHLDNTLAGKDDVDGFDSGDTHTSPPDEVCNGVDDDGDGLVDEGFPDDDGNGRVDCLDEACPELAAVAAGDVAVSDACDGRPDGIPDAWDVVYESRTLLPPLGTVVFPVVAHFDDDNGDGRMGEGDHPEVLVSTRTDGVATLVHADGSGVAWTWGGANDLDGLTLADVDRDGSPDIVAIGQSRDVVAIDASGAELWRTASFATDIMYYAQTAAADLDGDGTVEVIADGVLFHGATGGLVTVLSTQNAYRAPVLADLDGDGRLEILLGTEVFDSAGAPLWEGDAPWGTVFDAVFDADGDGEPEVLITNRDTITLYAADGTPVSVLPQPNERMGPPCVADFDGDGAPEIGVPNGGVLSVIEVDGTVLWTARADDASGYAGCSAFDFDLDGAAELLFAGETSFGIYDGRTGAARFLDATHTSATAMEYPVVADVDGDGAAEVVVVANSGPNQGVVVYGHRTDAWPGAGSTWCSHDFAVSNSPDDCAIDPSLPRSWRVDNLFRSRPALGPDAPPAAAQLVVDIADACIADCTWGPVTIEVVVENQGGADVDAGVTLAILSVDDGNERVVATTALPAVPAGRRLDGIVLALAPEDVGTRGLAARLDPEGLVDECVPGVVRVDRPDLACP